MEKFHFLEFSNFRTFQLDWSNRSRTLVLLTNKHSFLYVYYINIYYINMSLIQPKGSTVESIQWNLNEIECHAYAV